MKQRFRLYRRKNGSRFYLHDGVTGKQESLGTTDRTEARRLLSARNEAEQQPAVNLQIARAYLVASDRDIATRCWQTVMHEAGGLKSGSTRERWKRAMLDSAFDPNIAPPRKSTREVFDTLRSKINAEFGLADPDDPARARSKSNREPAFRAKLNQKADPKSKVKLPIEPNLRRALELETKLQTLVGARSEYHVKRYPAPSIENVSEPAKLISPFVSHDRTGTAPLGRAQALGISLRGARSGVCEGAGRFDQAALGWSRANEHSQHTIAEFVPKARSVALCAEKEIVAYQGRAAASALLTKYLIPLRSRSDAPDHDIDMEMEMPI